MKFFKSVIAAIKNLNSALNSKNEITSNDFASQNIPRWVQDLLMRFLEISNELRVFYRTKDGAQYEYLSHIPEGKDKDAVKVFTYLSENLKEQGLTQVDDEYIALCKKILDTGVQRGDRTGTGTIGIFGHQMRFDLSKGFPLLTTKRVFTKGIVAELIWFLTGSTNNNDLKKLGASIWDEWAKDDGDLGPIYGKQWRRWEGVDHNNFINTDNLEDEDLRQGVFYKTREIDQIANAIDQIRNNPNSRRIIVTAWNTNDIERQSLPACHTMFHFYVQNRKLSCHLYQRSGDVFLGIPFNIASHALLTHMVAQVCDLEVGEFIHTIGDAHIYNNHIDQVKEQISRAPMAMPSLSLDKTIKEIDDFKPEHFTITNYNPHPTIKGKVSV